MQHLLWKLSWTQLFVSQIITNNCLTTWVLWASFVEIVLRKCAGMFQQRFLYAIKIPLHDIKANGHSVEHVSSDQIVAARRHWKEEVVSEIVNFRAQSFFNHHLNSWLIHDMYFSCVTFNVIVHLYTHTALWEKSIAAMFLFAWRFLSSNIK